MKKLLLTALLCFCVNAYVAADEKEDGSKIPDDILQILDEAGITEEKPEDDREESILSEDVLKRLRDVTGSKPKASADWKYVYENVDGNRFYVDLNSIKNVKNRNIMFEYTILEDYFEKGVSFLLKNKGQLSSIIKKKRVHCKKRTEYWVSRTFYSQQMGQGRVIYDEVFKGDEGYYNVTGTIDPHEAHWTILKYVCELHGTKIWFRKTVFPSSLLKL